MQPGMFIGHRDNVIFRHSTQSNKQTTNNLGGNDYVLGNGSVFGGNAYTFGTASEVIESTYSGNIPAMANTGPNNMANFENPRPCVVVAIRA